MRRKAKNGLCFGVLLLTVVVFACDASPINSVSPPDAGEASSDHSDSTTADGVHELVPLGSKISLSDLRRIVVSFEQKQGSESDHFKFLQEDEPEVRWSLELNGFWVADVRFQMVHYRVDTRDSKVINVEYYDRKPTRVPDGVYKQTEIDKYRDKIVRITESQAEKAARDFVETHWSPSLLEGLGLREPEVQSNGSIFYYSVIWSLRASGEKVLFGFRQIWVDVNPTTGAVYNVLIVEGDPPDSYKISAEEFIEIVKEGFAAQPVEIETISIYTEYVEKALPTRPKRFKRAVRKRAVWSADVRFPCPDTPIFCYGRGTFMIDADTGEILINEGV